MVWYVQPMQLKDSEGNPSGKWHLIARSDEGGGFHVCSEKIFNSPEDAYCDRDSQVKAKEITGMPTPWEVEEIKRQNDPSIYKEVYQSAKDLVAVLDAPDFTSKIVSDAMDKLIDSVRKADQ